MNIVMVVSEAKPFCKTGGLADVAYSLSKELAKMGHDVSIIIPYYRSFKEWTKDLVEYLYPMTITLGWRKNDANVFYRKTDGISYYFIENGRYFDRASLYGDFDDGERFAFFSMAAKEVIYRFKDKPDIIHVHDWQPAMLPCLIKEDLHARDYFSKTKFVLTIHNPAFQGMMDREAIGDLYNLPDYLFDNGQLRHNGRFSTLKAGIVYSDTITTVSPTHHYELLTPEGGMLLDGVLQLREWDFKGILNGIDYKEFNPEIDTYLEAQYSKENFSTQKAKNKAKLFSDMGLTDYGKPLFSMVSRLTWQKGLDIMFSGLEALLRAGCNVVILGSGEDQYEARLEELRYRYPNNLGIYIGYNDSLAHKIYASSDFFMMPSLFEPCGLSQMISQRYGTLPIVRRTGGLKDSVEAFEGSNLAHANGFAFDTYCNESFESTCMYAYSIWQDKEKFHHLVVNAMNVDNSWRKSANEYEEFYKKTLEK